MAKKTVEVYACDGCRRDLGAGDGLVIHGQVYGAGPRAAGAKPLVGPTPGVRDGSAAETALCWACFRKATNEPQLPPRVETRTEYIERDDYRSRGGASGPLPPPELPHYARAAAALTGARRG